MARNEKFVRRGGIYCARRRVSEANRRAAAALRPEIPPAGPCDSASRADMESAPTRVCVFAGVRLPGWSLCFPPFCRAGVHARRTAAIQNRDVRNAAGCGGMRASRPTAARVAAAVPVGPRRKNIRRGGIYPARGTSRRCGVPGTMRASSPTWVCASRSAGRLPWFVGEGHGPPAGLATARGAAG